MTGKMDETDLYMVNAMNRKREVITPIPFTEINTGGRL
jgi:hypothetical protein